MIIGHNQFNTIISNPKYKDKLQKLIRHIVGFEIYDIHLPNDVEYYKYITNKFYSIQFTNSEKLYKYLTLPFYLNTESEIMNKIDPDHKLINVINSNGVHIIKLNEKFINKLDQRSKTNSDIFGRGKAFKTYQLLYSSGVIRQWTKNKTSFEQINILDYSSGDASKSINLKNILTKQLSKTKIILDCADVNTWSGYELEGLKSRTDNVVDNIYEINPTTQTMSSETNKPINKKYDLILLYVCLHHYGNSIDLALSNLSKLLEPSGVMFILEHDYGLNQLNRAIIDIEHVLYACKSPPRLNYKSGQIEKLSLETYIEAAVQAQSKFVHVPFNELNDKMKKLGLRCIDKYYDVATLDSQYYGIFQKS